MKSIRNTIYFLIVFALCLPMIFALEADAANLPNEEIKDSLGLEIKSKLSSNRIAGETLRSPALIKSFYQGRSFEPVWSRGSSPIKAVNDLIQAIEAVNEHGLDPNFYHLGAIKNLMDGLGSGGSSDNRLAELDLLSTDAFFALSTHLSSGMVDLFTGRVKTAPENPELDIAGLLNQAISGKNIKEALFGLAPNDEGYKGLMKALKYHRTLAEKGGWGTVPGTKKIEPGDRDSRLAAVRNRLKVTGELGDAPVKEEDLYDQELVAAVIKFQEYHGLDSDGVIGRGTIDLMNVTVDKKIDQIRKSLDAMRALSEIQDQKQYIVVNIPEYMLRVFEKENKVLEMKVVAGRVDRKTPLLQNSVKYIVFSPKWYVPSSIAIKDKLPKIHEDPDFISKQGMKVYAKDENGVHEVDPSTVDWTTVDSSNFNYSLVQDPSGGNALGTVKFMFPNKYSVYLHDTPTKSLFSKAMRPYSSGCIRIEKPVDLARYLLKDKSEWTEQKIKSAMGRGQQQFVNLDEHVPVYLVYYTAWVDEKGKTQFRKDIYNYDKPIEKYF